MKKTFLALTISLLLTACGGSDGDKSSSQPQQPDQPQSTNKIGVLTDGAISGATYIINGVTKQTNEAGEFEYQDGDQITFKIGEVTLGTVAASGRITPIDLVEDTHAQINMMIFLQSLDSDGDHTNGIQLSSTVIANLTSTDIDFDIDTNSFIDNFEDTLSNITGDDDVEVVSSETAQNNFKTALLKDISGVWYVKAGTSEDDSEIALIINDDGTYTMGEAVPNEVNSEGNGIEVGAININPLTGEFTTEASIDTNSDWGLHDPEGSRSMALKYDGVQLRIHEFDNVEEGATFSRIPQSTSGLTGAWKNSTGDQIFIFKSDNTFFLLDPEGDDLCGHVGIELGEYQYTNNTLKITNIRIDTNGCAGLSDGGSSKELSGNLQSNTVTFNVPDESPFTLNRIH